MNAFANFFERHAPAMPEVRQPPLFASKEDYQKWFRETYWQLFPLHTLGGATARLRENAVLYQQLKRYFDSLSPLAELDDSEDQLFLLLATEIVQGRLSVAQVLQKKPELESQRAFLQEMEDLHRQMTGFSL